MLHKSKSNLLSYKKILGYKVNWATYNSQRPRLPSRHNPTSGIAEQVLKIGHYSYRDHIKETSQNLSQNHRPVQFLK